MKKIILITATVVGGLFLVFSSSKILSSAAPKAVSAKPTNAGGLNAGQKSVANVCLGSFKSCRLVCDKGLKTMAKECKATCVKDFKECILPKSKIKATTQKPAQKVSTQTPAQKYAQQQCVTHFSSCLVPCRGKSGTQETDCRNTCRATFKSCMAPLLPIKAKTDASKSSKKIDTSKPGKVMINNQLDEPVTVRLRCKGQGKPVTIPAKSILPIILTDNQFAQCNQLDVLYNGKWQPLPQGFVSNHDDGKNMLLFSKPPLNNKKNVKK